MAEVGGVVEKLSGSYWPLHERVKMIPEDFAVREKYLDSLFLREPVKGICYDGGIQKIDTCHNSNYVPPYNLVNGISELKKLEFEKKLELKNVVNNEMCDWYVECRKEMEQRDAARKLESSVSVEGRDYVEATGDGGIEVILLKSIIGCHDSMDLDQLKNVPTYVGGPGDGKIEPGLRGRDNYSGVNAQVVGNAIYSQTPGVGGQNGRLGDWDNIGR